MIQCPARQRPSLPCTLIQAMAIMEGFYAANTRPNKNNNPGDIEYGKFTIAHGATGTDGRFAIFPSEDAGFAAMRALLQTAYNGLTVATALNKWAPPVENATSVYVEEVCKMTGLTQYAIVGTDTIG